MRLMILLIAMFHSVSPAKECIPFAWDFHIKIHVQNPRTYDVESAKALAEKIEGYLAPLGATAIDRLTDGATAAKHAWYLIRFGEINPVDSEGNVVFGLNAFWPFHTDWPSSQRNYKRTITVLKSLYDQGLIKGFETNPATASRNPYCSSPIK